MSAETPPTEDLQSAAFMTRPKMYLQWMGGFLGAAILVMGFVFGALRHAFMTNLAINGLIVLVLIAGIVLVFRQVIKLRPEVEWIERLRRHEDGLAALPTPELLAPMAMMLGERRGGRLSFSALSMRTLLDGIAVRLDEARDVSRYLIGLLIFLGLLGTFWGLLQTVSSVGETIRTLSVGDADIGEIFDDLKRGLEAPLAGMGTAFSSSLFGLIGSLILGLLDLIAGKAQNRFFNELEEWLSTLTRLSAGGVSVEGDQQAVPAYVSALLEQTAESLDDLRRIIGRAQTDQGAANAALVGLSDRLASLTDEMRADRDLLIQLAENQRDLRPTLQHLSQLIQYQSEHGGKVRLDEVTREHLRNLDVHTQRIAEDSARGRQQMVEDLRAEIKLLSRTLSAIAESRGRSS